ncbi:MAG: GtrA family protein [Rhizobiaceae bacterium]
MTGKGRTLGNKAGRFLVVGLINTVVDMSVFAALLSAGQRTLVANVIAWAVAVTFSYLVNSRWSFERNETLSTTRSVLRFVSLGALISLGVSSGVLAALTGWIGVWPAKILGVILAAILNFFAARWSIEDRIK